MHIYPASMSALPQPLMVPARWQPLRVVAAVLCFVAMVLVLSALFVPLYSGELTIDPEFGEVPTIEITYTPWSAEFNDPGVEASPGEVTKVGYPMVFGIVMLAAAATACWYAATPSASRAAGRAAGVVTAIAGAFLIGTVWTVALLVTSAVDAILLYGTMSPGLSTEATYLVGYWLVLIAAILGFGAAVLSLLPARRPAWGPSAPPYGYPMGPMAPHEPQAVVHALDPTTGQPIPGAQEAPYVRVDPLTGQPIQQNGQPPVSPWTGPQSPAAGIPAAPAQPWAAPPTNVDPLTGQPIAPPQAAPWGAQPVPPAAPEPWAAPPGPVAADPAPGEPSGVPAPPEAVEPPTATGNGAAPPPIELPDPPAPEEPKGPAIPASEDPLAEPPKS